MPITLYLDGRRVDPEAKRVMDLALEMARVALKLGDRPDINVAMVATKIIALAEGGELDPHRLCERVLADLGPYSPRE